MQAALPGKAAGSPATPAKRGEVWPAPSRAPGKLERRTVLQLQDTSCHLALGLPGAILSLWSGRLDSVLWLRRLTAVLQLEQVMPRDCAVEWRLAASEDLSLANGWNTGLNEGCPSEPDAEIGLWWRWWETGPLRVTRSIRGVSGVPAGVSLSLDWIILSRARLPGTLSLQPVSTCPSTFPPRGDVGQTLSKCWLCTLGLGSLRTVSQFSE